MNPVSTMTRDTLVHALQAILKRLSVQTTWTDEDSGDLRFASKLGVIVDGICLDREIGMPSVNRAAQEAAGSIRVGDITDVCRRNKGIPRDTLATTLVDVLYCGTNPGESHAL